MAGKHRPNHRALHPGRVLSHYTIAALQDGPWPGRLALGPAPVREGDPADIAAWGADAVLGLTVPGEVASLGVVDLGAHLAHADLAWINAPIADYRAPDHGFESDWPALRDALLNRLDAGEKILVHCRAGLGRSGTVVAALLIAAGMSPDDAMRAVRRARPGAIETTEQEAWLRDLKDAQPSDLEA